MCKKGNVMEIFMVNYILITYIHRIIYTHTYNSLIKLVEKYCDYSDI